jgi:hypothetical protein
VAIGSEVAALGPPDRRQERNAMTGQIIAHLPGGELHVRAGPPGCPDVFVVEPVEGCAALPVVPRQLEGVLHAEAALFGTVHQEDAAERPESLAAEVGTVLLVEHRNLLASPGELVGGDQSGKSCANDDDVCVHRW